MGMQYTGTAGSRNQMKADAKPSKVKVGAGSTPHSSTINAVGGPLSKAPQGPGKSVRGFTGTGVIKGKC